MSEQTRTFPKGFVTRRLHSLMGLWLVLYLIMHLLTNSLAALMPGEDGAGFILQVDKINSLPYLKAIELCFLALPILIHMVWGVRYLFTAKFNSFVTNGSKPALSQYSRNRAFTWQRLTSWVLLVGIIAHVIQMRFVDRPIEVFEGGLKRSYVVRLTFDPGLNSLTHRLEVQVYDQQRITALAAQAANYPRDRIQETLLQALQAKPVNTTQIMAVTPRFGTAVLLMLRDTFKSPWMLVLYTIFVSSAVYHAFNGLWSFAIVWGVTLTERSRQLLLKSCWLLILVVGFLGLAAVWGTYWVNLRG
jgi:succinate dehydrogenase / fumarate reductase, cytochrome b subunit